MEGATVRRDVIPNFYIYLSCNWNGELGILGARLFPAFSTDHLHDIRLYALHFRHFIFLASHIQYCDRSL